MEAKFKIGDSVAVKTWYRCNYPYTVKSVNKKEDGSIRYSLTSQLTRDACTAYANEDEMTPYDPSNRDEAIRVIEPVLDSKLTSEEIRDVIRYFMEMYDVEP